MRLQSPLRNRYLTSVLGMLEHLKQSLLNQEFTPRVHGVSFKVQDKIRPRVQLDPIRVAERRHTVPPESLHEKKNCLFAKQYKLISKTQNSPTNDSSKPLLRMPALDNRRPRNKKHFPRRPSSHQISSWAVDDHEYYY